MQRVSFVLKMRPGMESEYEKRHQAVFPDLLEAFEQVGIRTYSIFRDGLTLFAYMEVENFEEAINILEIHPANIRWQESMKPIMEQGGDQPLQVIPEVFYFHAKDRTE